MRKSVSVIALLALFFTGSAGAEPADVIALGGTNYFATVHRELREATTSIDVAMYLVRLYPHSTTSSPTFVLVQDLVAARMRGVNVRVVLDRSYRYAPGSGKRHVDPKNETAARILAAAGTDVGFTPPDTILHEKLIVLDGKKIIAGSHNWSDAALQRDTEVSFLIESVDHARAEQERLASIPIGERLSAESMQGTIPVPLDFITDRRFAPTMVSRCDERAFDCYLYLLNLRGRGETTNNVLSVDYNDMAAAFGMDRAMDRVAYRRQISKTLRHLEKGYRLLTCEFRYGEPADVIVTARSQVDAIECPSEMWAYGYMRSLSLPAKFAYLICLAERDRGDTLLSWQVSGAEMAKRYSGNGDTIRRGLLELEQANILRIVRSTVPPGKTFAERAPNRYTLMPLLSEDEIREQWEALADMHGEAEVDRARTLALKLDRGNSPEVVANLVRVIATYGYESTLNATEQVAKMAPDNPCRHMGYVVTLIQNEE